MPSRQISGLDVTALDPGRPVLIAGPTASGKSGLAAWIVQQGGGVIINADALQVYSGWRILTARPSPAEEAALPHALYGHVGRDQPYSVGHWLREVESVLSAGQRPVIVGGTGLYFTALTEGLVEMPATPPEIRTEADAFLRDSGLDAMISGLDQATAARIDLRNPARVQRAWEVLRATGRGLADWQAETGRPLLPLAEVTPLVLMPDRDWLADRIDARFDAMIAGGALEEVHAALPGWNPALPFSRAIGAPELVAYLMGEIPLDQAIASAKLSTRQYAKRQRTWFRNRMKQWRHLTIP
ncbi:MAG: tRNA (adenosine(37)-N6)-dimethylallyltransferase MiaA [Cereibacter sphaeroides]|uniref:tRNA dimethylallyltransferase n=1 Tax=Cereibacter sphaeroides TaxID=1063 RepID=A0A2W5UP47_CERSP|nr:MAG: tRNA (adenosine(37)-N6)-dimethylallyltransferase MiaA [Cereibacter sphaeroides]